MPQKVITRAAEKRHRTSSMSVARATRIRTYILRERKSNISGKVMVMTIRQIGASETGLTKFGTTPAGGVIAGIFDKSMESISSMPMSRSNHRKVEVRR